MSPEIFVHYITQYGYIGLFITLGISIMGLPVPDEFLMAFVGFLSFSGKLNPVMAIVAAAAGSMTGITATYFLGHLFGEKVIALLHKHAGNQRMDKVLHWYQRHGAKLLTVGYFIPGVRHLSGYVAGISGLPYRSFALFAYLGAVLWTTLFISLGHLLGSRWQAILPMFHRYSLVIGIAAVVLFLAFYLLYKNHERWGVWLYAELKRLPLRYASLGRRRLFYTVGALLFLGLFVVLMGLIQDLVAQEVGEFDAIVAEIIEITSPPGVIYLMQHLNFLGTHAVLLLVFLGSIFWLHVSGTGVGMGAGSSISMGAGKLKLVVWPLALAWGGGTLIDQLFRLLFKGENLNFFENLTPFQAPSSGFLLAAISFYVVLGYILAREQSWRQQFLIFGFDFMLIILLGLSPIYLRTHTPSAMVTGLVVSLLWAFVCVFVYEFMLFRSEEAT
ncbi:MAG: VTT domain-containing protein [Desulfitobacteriaceae bacterium]|nr:VTT domain-containing protein [Desulfitobacteriaceae bacterium]MDI6914075.1 VTT domain-containing protein [Desulfitobacteriaceae bacterium]